METIEDSPNYGLLIAKYQLLEMARLNKYLRKHGVSDRGVRYRICSDFFSGHGLLLDADGDPFPWEGKDLHPILCFAERFPRASEKPAHLRKIYLDYHANLYWQTEASLRLLFQKSDEDLSEFEKDLEEELGQPSL
jgi:hypothetical protein